MALPRESPGTSASRETGRSQFTLWIAQTLAWATSSITSGRLISGTSSTEKTLQQGFIPTAVLPTVNLRSQIGESQSNATSEGRAFNFTSSHQPFTSLVAIGLFPQTRTSDVRRRTKPLLRFRPILIIDSKHPFSISLTQRTLMN